MTATNATSATANTTEPSVYENKVAEKILDAAFLVHRELGPALLESAYEICICDLLKEQNMEFERQKNVPITFRNRNLDAGFRADLIVEGCVLVELKSVEKLIPLHEAQVLTYLKLSKIKLGLLMNFNARLLKDGIRRLVLTQNA